MIVHELLSFLDRPRKTAKDFLHTTGGFALHEDEKALFSGDLSTGLGEHYLSEVGAGGGDFR
ncbi:MAG TPA: hypothetical protein VN944_09855 [Nitrospiria bacterium]|nr:hypothetical protein [Nitrospiria bacterium]